MVKDACSLADLVASARTGDMPLTVTVGRLQPMSDAEPLPGALLRQVSVDDLPTRVSRFLS